MNRNQLIKLAKEKIEKRLQSRQVNNYFIFWKGKEKKDVPDKSLVIILTEYEPEENNVTAAFNDIPTEIT